MKAVALFLHRNPAPQLRLLLALDDPSSQRAAFEAARAAEPGLASEPRFTLRAAPLLKLASDAGVRAAAIANPANHRLSAKGGGLNRAVHAAAPALEGATRAAFSGGIAAAGRVLAVPLPTDCPLRATQGVEYVIHAVAPNMHPNRPDCLDGDYDTGCRQLAETYEHLFREFVGTVLH